ncbi:hypothetical protein HanXRQr2_Chr16g0746021 [Helianthus annuus]|uniref:Uncharacterized protein n=1 Tax=Helianthus annuus TaxID=4232 RepID=A0A251RZA6_HELAN|nr:hypothetical protein HanXRQr2_Chr16g0746021 [Helianthus annuus]KAJ0821034.1 hypothetical protein HanPSC8_Chr16g0715241 [Helianthus annuus]
MYKELLLIWRSRERNYLQVDSRITKSTRKRTYKWYQSRRSIARIQEISSESGLNLIKIVTFLLLLTFFTF